MAIFNIWLTEAILDIGVSFKNHDHEKSIFNGNPVTTYDDDLLQKRVGGKCGYRIIALLRNPSTLPGQSNVS
jgi:hypothetical protein